MSSTQVESGIKDTTATMRAHLLVVDDDFMLRSMAAKTLRHAGFEVRFEVCQRLRGSQRGARVPVICSPV